MKEGGHINKSLLSLSTVIGKLAEGGGHVPYRDSKLTRILQPSLGGNSITAIICTITLAPHFCEETLSTLKFAARAKTIKTKPQINEILSDEALLKKYEVEIKTLRKQIDEMKDQKLKGVEDEEISFKAVDEIDEEKATLEKKIEALKGLILNSEGTIPSAIAKKRMRRKTWFPGVFKESNPVEHVPFKKIKVSDDFKQERIEYFISFVCEESGKIADELSSLEKESIEVIKELGIQFEDSLTAMKQKESFLADELKSYEKLLALEEAEKIEVNILFDCRK